VIRRISCLIPVLLALVVAACAGGGGGGGVSDLVKGGEKALESGKVEEAVQQFQQAIEQGDETAAAFGGRGRALLEQGRSAEAVSDLTRAIELDPKSDVYLETRGLALIERFRETGEPGLVDRAVEDFRRAIELRPDRIGPVFGRAEALFLRGDLEAALADLEECVRRSDRFQRAWLLKGRANAVLGRVDAARADFEKVLRLDPDGGNGAQAREELGRLP